MRRVLAVSLMLAGSIGFAQNHFVRGHVTKKGSFIKAHLSKNPSPFKNMGPVLKTVPFKD